MRDFGAEASQALLTTEPLDQKISVQAETHFEGTGRFIVLSKNHDDMAKSSPKREREGGLDFRQL